jgi:hypothetical protein
VISVFFASQRSGFSAEVRLTDLPMRKYYSVGRGEAFKGKSLSPENRHKAEV